MNPNDPVPLASSSPPPPAPFIHINWGRLADVFGELPPCTGDEKHFLKLLRRHRRALTIAFLVTAAIFLGVEHGGAEQARLVAILTPYLQPLASYPMLAVTLGLLAAALLISWIKWVVTRTWRYQQEQCFRHGFILVLATALLVLRGSGHPVHPAHAIVYLLIFITLVPIFISPEPREEKVPDDLHRLYFANKLIQHLKTEGITSRRIALLGSWGSGKTTILQLLRHKLLEEKEPQFRSALVNPWRSRSEDEARATIARAFDDALGGNGNLARTWRHSLWTRLSGIEMDAGLGITLDLVRLFEGTSTVAEDRLVARINQRIDELKVRIVILVDDMERADPEIVRKMFPLIDRLNGVRNCFFIFAIDPDRIARAFGEDRRSQEETKGYMDKVFDLQFDLPTPSQDDVARLCCERINGAETPKLKATFDSIRKHLPTNPRTVLQFMDDARTHEILYLQRYDDDERPFDAYFLYRLCEVEFRGIGNVLASADHWHLFQEAMATEHEASFLPASHTLNTAETSNPLTKLAQEVASHLQIHMQGERWDRLRHLVHALVIKAKAHASHPHPGLRHVDARWVIYEPVKLTALTRREIGKVELAWATRAGTLWFSDLLSHCFPEYRHIDPVACARQFLASESEVIRDLLIGPPGDLSLPPPETRLTVALARVERLRAQAAFTRLDRSSDESSLFARPFFTAWCFDAIHLPAQGIAASKLHEACTGLVQDWIATLPLAEAFAWQQNEWQQCRDEVDPSAAPLPGWERFRLAVSKSLSTRIFEETLSCMRSGHIPDHWPLHEPGLAFFDQPANWLHLDDADSCAKALEHLLYLASHDTAIARACAVIVRDRFLGNPDDYFAGTATRIHANTEGLSPEYPPTLWRCSQCLPGNDPLRLHLLQLRTQIMDVTRQKAPHAAAIANSFTKQIEQWFPIP